MGLAVVKERSAIASCRGMDSRTCQVAIYCVTRSAMRPSWPLRSKQSWTKASLYHWSVYSASFLANGNSTFTICCRPSVCLSVCLSSVVCNASAPYSGGCNFRQFFYGIWYLGHPLTSTENFMEIVSGKLSAGELNPRGIAKYRPIDFGPIEGYISETVQDTR